MRKAFKFGKFSNLFILIISQREGLDNPYNGLLDWVKEEEIDIEAMNEAIVSLNLLFENKEKINQKFLTNEKDLNDMNCGRKSFKTMFGIKSTKSEIEKFKAIKETVINLNFFYFKFIFQLEKNLSEYEIITKLTTFNMESYINNFKGEKLAGYYKALNSFADLQNRNSIKINNLWTSVANDKNLKKEIEIEETTNKQIIK